MNQTQSEALFKVSKTLFPGGVNSPVRAFKSVGGTPLFIKKGDGAFIWDEDGNRFLDFCCSWGPLILGHNNPKIREQIEEQLQNGTSFGAPTRLENELGQLIIDNHPYLEKIRFVSSGTEAVMSAIRLARAYTNRTKIIKFDGCYHGHTDALLVQAGSGLVTFGSTSSAGVPESFVNETLVVPLNNIEALETAFERFPNEIAAVIIEPIPANNGLLQVDASFLKALRAITQKYNCLLIFDEVISGFRVHFAGAAGLYQIQPDIITMGKIIGGGLPVGAYGASAAIMAQVSPDGPMYQAGTLSGNPIAMAAGLAQLNECVKKGFYEQLEEKTIRFVTQINTHAQEKGYPFHIQHIGSIFWLCFSDKSIMRADEITAEGIQKFNKLYWFLLENGIYFGPSGYEVVFVSVAHKEEQLHQAAQIINQGLDLIYTS